MGTLVIYYSYTGHTRAIAQRLAEDLQVDIIEIRDMARPGVLKAYTSGVVAVIQGKVWPMQPIEADLSSYDKLILLTPVWAGNMPPVMNGLWDKLPSGKAVEVKMISASGSSRCKEKLEKILAAKGCTLEGFEDIKG